MKRFLAAVLVGVALAGPALADDEDEQEQDRKQFPHIEKVLAGWKEVQIPNWREQDGYFLRVYKKDQEEKLLAVLQKELLNEPFLIATSIAGGSSYAGWQWQDKLVRLERFNRQLLLVELNVQQRAKEGAPIEEVVRRTYADRLLTSIPIQGVGPKGELLIDLGSLLLDRMSVFFGRISLQTYLARFVKAKAFPENVEVGIRAPGYDGTFQQVHYSISKLPAPKDHYTPRLCDDRIGYFDTAIRDYTEGDAKEGRMIRLVNRWKLEKADESLKMSPAKEPIVFYIEKTVPIAYRRAVAEGILEWNRAFEKIGLDNAIVVRQQTDTQFADRDPEDVRYNFFRWITSETAFAMGPSRVDPRTGRILDADIIFDDSMLRGYMRDYDILIREGPKKLLPRSVAAWLERHPDQHPLARFNRAAERGDERMLRARAALADLLGVPKDDPRGPLAALLAAAGPAPAEAAAQPPAAALHDAAGAARHRRNRTVCQLGEMLPQQLGLLGLLRTRASGAAGGEAFEDYLAQIVKETVMHEVGHTLGLRHNFKASSIVDLDKVNSKERPEVLSASVMDYHPINIAGDPEHPQGYFLTRSIGPYDYLAIEYGYKLVKEDSKELKEVPAKLAAQGLPFATDEELDSPDPLIMTWDLGDDSVKFADYRVRLVKRIWGDLEKRSVADGEAYSRLRRALDITLFEVQYAAVAASRVVGGLSFFRDHKGDPQARLPISVVPQEKQRAALEWLAREVLGGAALAVPPDLVDKLSASRWVDWSNGYREPALEYSVLDRINMIQSWVLFFLLRDDVLARVWENEQRVLKGKAAEGAGPLTLPELFDTLDTAIFGELDKLPAEATAHAPAISSVRQGLQDSYVRRLIQIALGGNGMAPPVANKQAWVRLMNLEKRFQAVLGNPRLDPYTRAHLQTLMARGAKVREAEYVHIASGLDALCALGRAGDPRSPALPLTVLALGLALLVALRLRVAARASAPGPAGA